MEEEKLNKSIDHFLMDMPIFVVQQIYKKNNIILEIFNQKNKKLKNIFQKEMVL